MSTTELETAVLAPAKPRRQLHDLLARYGTVMAAVVIFALFAASSGRFMSTANLRNILVKISVLTVI